MDPMQKPLKLALSLANMKQLCGCKKNHVVLMQCVQWSRFVQNTGHDTTTDCYGIRRIPPLVGIGSWSLLVLTGWNQQQNPSSELSWFPVVFHVCVQILANYLLGCGKTWNRSPFPICATLSHHFTTAWRIAGQAALPNGHSGQVARDIQLAHPKG